MKIIETPIFTKRVLDILPEEEYRLFQIELLENPEAGKIKRLKLTPSTRGRLSQAVMRIRLKRKQNGI